MDPSLARESLVEAAGARKPYVPSSRDFFFAETHVSDWRVSGILPAILFRLVCTPSFLGLDTGHLLYIVTPILVARSLAFLWRNTDTLCVAARFFFSSIHIKWGCEALF